MAPTATKTPSRTVEEIQQTAEELQRRQHDLQANHETEMARLEAEREKAVEIRRPFDLLTQQAHERRVKIERVQQHLAAAQQHARAWQEHVDMAMNSDSFGGTIDFISLQTQRPDLAIAERAVAEMSRWLAARVPELEQLEKERVEYAKANGLSYLLTK